MFAHRTQQKGNKQKSIDTFGEILERVRKKFKPNHHRVGAALHNLGYSQLVAGQYEKAVFSLKNAVSIREHTFDCHPLVVVSSFIQKRKLVVHDYIYNMVYSPRKINNTLHHIWDRNRL